MADNSKVQKQLKIITEHLEQGIKDVFENGGYQKYLDVMSRFHNYSINNTMLIAMQKPDATLVAGYNAWKTKFGRYVKKDEHGISIIAPNPIKIVEEKEKLDPITKKPILNKSGQPMREEVETTQMTFRVIKVFDVSQTEGRELPVFAITELTGSVENYDIFMQAFEAVSPVPIGFEIIENGAYGYYHLVDKRIAIKEGLSELHTLKTAIHEISHAMLHEINLNNKEHVPAEHRQDSKEREVEAESIAYTVCTHYGLDTSNYSFGYIAGWSSGRELPELKKSLETIRKTSSELISAIDERVNELIGEKEIVAEQYDGEAILNEASGKELRGMAEEIAGSNYKQMDGPISNTGVHNVSSKGAIHKKLAQAKEIIGQVQGGLPARGASRVKEELVK